MKITNSKILDQVLKSTADSAQKSFKAGDVLAVPAVYEHVKFYAESSDAPTFKEIGAELDADKDYNEEVKKAFGDKKVSHIAPAIIKQYFFQKYDLRNKLIHYYDFNVDEFGAESKSKTVSMINSVEKSTNVEGNPARDVEIVKNSLAVSDPADLRTEYMIDKVKLLSFGNVTATEKQDLTVSYINFHTENASSRLDFPSYPERLGTYYYNVINAVGDAAKALAFIDDNFDLMVQPPVQQLPEGKPYSVPGFDDMALAIRAAANDRVEWKNMATALEKGEEFFGKYPSAKTQDNAQNEAPVKETKTERKQPDIKAPAPAKIKKEAPVPVAAQPAKKAAQPVQDAPVASVSAAEKTAELNANLDDIVTLTPEAAQKLDNVVEQLGGVDKTFAILQTMLDQQVSAADIVKQKEEKAEVDSILKITENLSPAMREMLIKALTKTPTA